MEPGVFCGTRINSTQVPSRVCFSKWIATLLLLSTRAGLCHGLRPSVFIKWFMMLVLVGFVLAYAYCVVFAAEESRAVLIE